MHRELSDKGSRDSTYDLSSFSGARTLALSIAIFVCLLILSSCMSISSRNEITSNPLAEAKSLWLSQFQYNNVNNRVVVATATGTKTLSLPITVPLGGDAWDGCPFTLTAHFMDLVRPTNRKQRREKREVLGALNAIENVLSTEAYSTSEGVNTLEHSVNVVNYYFGIGAKSWNYLSLHAFGFGSPLYMKAGREWYLEPSNPSHGVTPKYLRSAAADITRLQHQSVENAKEWSGVVVLLRDLEDAPVSQVSGCNVNSSSVTCTEIASLNYVFGLVGLNTQQEDRLE